MRLCSATPAIQHIQPIRVQTLHSARSGLLAAHADTLLELLATGWTGLRRTTQQAMRMLALHSTRKRPYLGAVVLPSTAARPRRSRRRAGPKASVNQKKPPHHLPTPLPLPMASLPRSPVASNNGNTVRCDTPVNLHCPAIAPGPVPAAGPSVTS